ncbi:hypothetical protein [Mucilaginibacter sp. CSA2-8R]|uniref:hypothetical protein n=1 Tax=Mucilaginibacter sp. CSA2-8R TaxID=3141542 RepID=UPI00315D5A0D
MKEQLNKVWMTAVLVTGFFAAQAQQLPQPPKPQDGPDMLARGPQPPRPPKRPMPVGPENGKMPQEALKLTTLKGTVVNPVANDRFEYNGLLVKTASGNTQVLFPPHLGEQILAKAKGGAAVTITGFERTNPEGKAEFRLVTLNVNGTMITDTPPVAPQLTVAREQKSITAKIKELNYTPQKEVNGFTLSSGEQVNIPPHIANQLSSQLKAGTEVIVNGFAEPKRPGVVYSQNVTMIAAQTISINGQAYLVR